MRGKADRQATMLSILAPEQVVPAEHPIRQIKAIVNRVLAELSLIFDAMYADLGRGPDYQPANAASGLAAHAFPMATEPVRTSSVRNSVSALANSPSGGRLRNWEWATTPSNVSCLSREAWLH